MITFLYLLACLIWGGISVDMDILYVTAAIDIIAIVGEVTYKLYQTSKL